MSPDSDPGASTNEDPVPEPQGRVLGVPYDLRRPTVARLRSRWWNKDDPRLLTPKTFGAGWDLNLYWAAHPDEYLRRKSAGS